jgi:hypothetical protein
VSPASSRTIAALTHSHFYSPSIRMAQGFKDHSGGIMDGCVSALDGLVVRTRAPFKSEVPNVVDYCNRKGGFAEVVLAGCDVRGKFNMAAANYSGSTHDALAWQMSAFKKMLDDGRLDPRYFVIGDEAFPCTDQMLSPWPGRGIGRWKDSFNYWLSHSRQCIERAFGMLVKRWGIFWCKFLFSFDRWSLVIITCMKLHNVCIDRDVTLPTRRYAHDQEQGDEEIVLINNDPERDALLRDRAVGARRTNLTNELEAEGRGHPIHAACNARA